MQEEATMLIFVITSDKQSSGNDSVHRNR